MSKTLGGVKGAVANAVMAATALTGAAAIPAEAEAQQKQPILVLRTANGNQVYIYDTKDLEAQYRASTELYYRQDLAESLAIDGLANNIAKSLKGLQGIPADDKNVKSGVKDNLKTILIEVAAGVLNNETLDSVFRGRNRRNQNAQDQRLWQELDKQRDLLYNALNKIREAQRDSRVNKEIAINERYELKKYAHLLPRGRFADIEAEVRDELRREYQSTNGRTMQQDGIEFSMPRAQNSFAAPTNKPESFVAAVRAKSDSELHVGADGKFAVHTGVEAAQKAAETAENIGKNRNFVAQVSGGRRLDGSRDPSGRGGRG